MTQGKIQLAPQGSTSLDKRVITISRPQRPDPSADADDPLFVNVIRRRWLLLAFCALLSGVAAGLVAYKFEMPKATSTGKLRYVQLPPSISQHYPAPKTIELAEMLQSNENMSELARRMGLQIDPKTLGKRFNVVAARYSNIIGIEVRWRDGQGAIDILNELMRIACETTAANRKATLQQYGAETALQLADAQRRVQDLSDHVRQLRHKQYQELNANGEVGTEAERIVNTLASTENELDRLTVKRVSLNRQLDAIRSDVNAVRRQIKEKLVSSRLQQIKRLQEAYNPNSQQFSMLRQAEKQLEEFDSSSSSAQLEYLAWRTELETIGATLIGEIEPQTLAAIEKMEKSLLAKQAKMDQVEFELLPLDGELSMHEARRESLERRLADHSAAVNISSTELEEAETQMAAAIDSLQDLTNTLNDIRRGEETEFSEMKVMTPASWQTTETSNGKVKLLVLTFAGCFTALVLPVFALEHFFPSGDPAEHAAKALGIPRISRGTFVTQSVKTDRRNVHPVNTEAMRLLALRIQQSVHGPGSMVLFSGLNHEKSAIPMISYLAECLSRREEKVLIIDACDRPSESTGHAANQASVDAVITPQTDDEDGDSVDERSALPANLGNAAAGVVGISDFLRRRDLGPDQMICPTSIPGVDIIPSGTSSFPREGLASSSLTGLFEECRRRYTMILVAGPSTQHPSDLQMLSARADGILFTVPPTGRPAGQGEEVVRDLLDMGAPVIGIVS